MMHLFSPFILFFNKSYLRLALRIFSFANFLILPAWQIVLTRASVLPSWWQLYEMTFGLFFFGIATFADIKLIEIARINKYFFLPAIIFSTAIAFFFVGSITYLKQSILNGGSLIEPFVAMGIHPIVAKVLLIGFFALLLMIFRKKLFNIFNQLLDLVSPLFFILVISFLWTFHNAESVQKNKVHDVHGRQVVWLVFDELDSRFLQNTSQDLPYFKALNDRGIMFTNAYPPANATYYSLPSYWLGKIPESIRIGSNGVELKVDNEWLVNWNKNSTIFRQRIEAGDSVFIRGSYLPYCRTFSGSAKVPCRDHPNFYGPGENIGILRWLIQLHLATLSILYLKLKGCITFINLKY